MTGAFYKTLVASGRFVGFWVMAAFGWIISTGYFLFSPKKVGRCMEFYGAVFPEKSRGELRRLVLRQFHHFATVFSDRLILARESGMAFETRGMERFEQVRAQGRGGIFLMSHFGNWEVAARLFRRQGMDLMVHLGSREKEQVEKMQKKDLALDGVRVSVAREEGSPLALMESVRFIKNGGFVSLAGDRVQSERQKTLSVPFFGRQASFPIAAHTLAALVKDVPIFALFTARLGKGRFRVILTEPWTVERTGRRERASALAGSMKTYTALLEGMVKGHPEHWYNFDFAWDEVKNSAAGEKSFANDGPG